MAKTKDTYAWGMRAVGPVAWLVALSTLAGGVFSVIRVWAMTPIYAPVTVQQFLPGGAAGEVLGGGFTSGELLVDTLPLATKVWATVSIGSGVALWVWIALTVATIAASVRDGAGFTRRLPRALGLLGVAVIVFGITMQVASQLASVFLAESLFPAAGDGPQTGPTSEFFVTLDGWSWPLWVAFALGVFAFVFDRAAKLQRDAAGLV